MEDSKLVLQILAHVASQQLSDYVVHFATSFKEGCAIYEKHKDKIFASIVDLNLPDAPNGEMANYLLANDTPIIVLTGNYSDENRNRLLQLGVVDYVTKENRYSYEHAIGLIKRLEMNLAILTLAKHTSSLFRRFWRVENNNDFNSIPKVAISSLGLSEPEYIDLQDQLLTRMQEEQKKIKT